MAEKKELIRRLHKHRGIVRIEGEPFEKDGIWTPVHLRVETISNYPLLRKDLIEGVARMIEDNEVPFDVIVEDRQSKIALAEGLGEVLGKRHGYIGDDLEGARMLPVDPAAGKGTGSVRLVKEIRDMGGEVSDFVVLYYWQAGAAEALKKEGVRLYAYLTGNEVFDPSYDFMPITHAGDLKVYFERPEEWHRKHGLEYRPDDK